MKKKNTREQNARRHDWLAFRAFIGAQYIENRTMDAILNNTNRVQRQQRSYSTKRKKRLQDKHRKKKRPFDNNQSKQNKE
jgi:hypothetical protein